MKKAMTISAFAKAHGLSRATLLYYERIGLLKPAGQNPAGYRMYGMAEAQRMTRINTFREAGIPLKAIRALLDGNDPDTMQEALEQRLVSLNREIAQLRSQQRLVVEMLRREGGQTEYRQVDVAQWIALLEEAGVDEAGRQRWHQAFEREAPQAHQAFLQSLGLDEATISAIRQRSR